MSPSHGLGNLISPDPKESQPDVNDHDIAELSRVTTGNSALDASVLNTGLCGIVRRHLDKLVRFHRSGGGCTHITGNWFIVA